MQIRKQRDEEWQLVINMYKHALYKVERLVTIATQMWF